MRLEDNRIGEMEYPYVLLKSKELHLVDGHGGSPVGFSIGTFHTF